MMDEKKNATINVVAIVLEKLEFERQQQISSAIFSSDGSITTVNLKLEAKIERQFSEDKTKLLTKFQLKVSDADNTLSILCRVAGLFVQTEDGSMNLEEFAKVNAPTFLLPYVRENISTVTMKAGLPPIILPPLNMLKFINETSVEEK